MRSLFALSGSIAFGLGICHYIPTLGTFIVILAAMLFLASVRCQPGKLRSVIRSIVAALAISASLVLTVFLATTVLRDERFAFPPIAQGFAAFAVFAVVVVLRYVFHFTWGQQCVGVGLMVAVLPGIAFLGVGDLRNYLWGFLTAVWLFGVYIMIPFFAAAGISAIAEQYLGKRPM